jgi:hypothetical protein
MAVGILDGTILAVGNQFRTLVDTHPPASFHSLLVLLNSLCRLRNIIGYLAWEKLFWVNASSTMDIPQSSFYLLKSLKDFLIAFTNILGIFWVQLNVSHAF